MVGITNLLPTFGPIIGGALGAFILLLVNPDYVLWFLIFTVLLQTVDAYIIKPQLFGDSLGISPLWVTVAIVVGGRKKQEKAVAEDAQRTAAKAANNSADAAATSPASQKAPGEEPHV